MNSETFLNDQLLAACTSDRIDYQQIEKWLQEGAKPLGKTRAPYGHDENLFSLVIDHYLNINYEIGDCNTDFFKITELFLRYGMDFAHPEIPYAEDCSNPLWSFAFFHGKMSLRVLKLLLDHGLDAESAMIYWWHDYFDSLLAEIEFRDEEDFKWLFELICKLLLIASYPHILSEDKTLQEVIWLSENAYDLNRFRNWDDFSFSIDTSLCESFPQMRRSIVKVVEKSSKKAVWTLGIELEPSEYKTKLPSRCETITGNTLSDNKQSHTKTTL